MSRLNLHEIDEILERYKQEEEDEFENEATSDEEREKISGGMSKQEWRRGNSHLA